MFEIQSPKHDKSTRDWSQHKNIIMWEKTVSDSVQKQNLLYQLKIQNTKLQKHAVKMFDYTAIAGRLRTINWGNLSHPAGRVNQFMHENFLLKKHIWRFENKSRSEKSVLRSNCLS